MVEVNNTPPDHACAACGDESCEGAGCPACATLNPASAHFCQACGAPLSSPAQADRRVVTVLFGDLSGYTQLTEEMDPEEVRELVADCLECLCESVSRWGGYVDKFIGDCVMALFGAPVAYENEAERAVRAALGMQGTLCGWKNTQGESGGDGHYRPELRVGVATGPVVMGLFAGGGGQNYTAVGDTVNVAARLEGLCEPGRVLVDAKTYEQTRHLFEYDDEQVLQVKGRREPVAARHVRGVRAERMSARGFQGRRTALVGRDEELALLRRQWTAAATGEFRLCAVSGPPGIGKSRLVAELVDGDGLPGVRGAQGRSYPYSSSKPWEPLAELIRELYDVASDSAIEQAIARIVGAAPSEWSPEEITGLKIVLGSCAMGEERTLQHYSAGERHDRVLAALRRCLLGVAKSPHVLVLEDLHWADRTTLEALCQLPELGLAGPFLMVLVSRDPLPDETVLGRLLEVVSDRIKLGPFTPDVAGQFIEELLGTHELPEDFLERVIGRAEGNPLFIEETLKSLVESGALTQVDGVWRVGEDVQELEVPDTIESVLTTRIGALNSATKSVLQYAAVVGRRFWAGVLADVLARRPVDQELEQLLDGAFVRAQSASSIGGDREFLFEHLMLHQVAYEGMLRGFRAELHGAVGEWLESRIEGAASDHDEWIAHHYERSKDPERALPFLSRAAHLALARGALPEAQSLAERALELASGSAAAAELLTLAEETAAEAGDVERRRAAIEQLESLARHLGEAGVTAEADYRRARYLLDTGDLAGARERGELALAGFERTGDISMQADVMRLLGRVAHLSGNCAEALRFYRASLPLEREAGDRFGQAEIFDRLGLVQVDVGDFTTGLDYFEAARSQYAELGYRPAEARVIGHQATALRGLGRYEAAETAARSALQLAEQCGSLQAQSGARLALAMVCAARSDSAAATTLLQTVCEAARQLAQPGLEARAWSQLAQIESGAEAGHSARRAFALAQQSGLVHVEIMALNREAELALDVGNLEGADRASAEATRKLRLHGNIQGPEEVVLYTRVRALSALGREDEKLEVLGEARDTVRRRADLIEDAELRRRFLEEIPLHREILGLGEPQRRNA
jgi:adenylate cyclase